MERALITVTTTWLCCKTDSWLIRNAPGCPFAQDLGAGFGVPRRLPTLQRLRSQLFRYGGDACASRLLWPRSAPVLLQVA